MCNAHFISCFANSCNLIKILKQYLNIPVFSLYIHNCIRKKFRFVHTNSTEKNYAHRLACILFPNVTEIIFNHKLCFIATSIRLLLCIRAKIDNSLDQPSHHSYVKSSI